MNIPDNIRQLKDEFKFFKTLTDDELSTFLGFCGTKQIDEGEILWKEGDEYHYAAFIVSGKIGIKKQTEFEGHHMIVGTFGPGSIVGELCILGDRPRSATAVVLEPVDAISLSSDSFEMMMSEYPKLALKLLKHIFSVTVGRLKSTTDRISRMF